MRAQTRKALQTLLRLKKEQVDAIAAEQSACMSEIEKLRYEKALTLENLEKERHFAGEIDALQTFSAFTQKVVDKVEAVDREIEALRRKIEKLSQEFEKAYKELKANEKVLEKAQDQKQIEDLKFENELLDEVGLRKFYKTR